LKLKQHNAVFKSPVHNVTAILGDRRSYAGIQEFLNLGHDSGIWSFVIRYTGRIFALSG